MNELITPHNIGVKNALENMKELLALYKKVVGNYRPLLDGGYGKGLAPAILTLFDGRVARKARYFQSLNTRRSISFDWS